MVASVPCCSMLSFEALCKVEASNAISGCLGVRVQDDAHVQWLVNGVR